MKMLLLPVAVILCFTASTIQAVGVQVGFGELDYREIEGTGGVNVVVQKENENFGTLVLTVQTLSFSEIDPARIPPELTLPDPAEFDVNGRQDFVKTTKRVTFQPSKVVEEQNLFFEFLDDDINEKAEGFFAVIDIDESESDARDIADFGFIRHGVTLLVIKDDDAIQLRLGSPSYTVEETAGAVSQLISIQKVDDRLTEQELEVFVQLSPGGGDGSAENGKDFEIAETKTITLEPNQQNAFVPFVVFDDDISEFLERFNIFLSIPEGKGVYSLGTPSGSNVFIRDNEVPRIGFESTVYTVTETDPSTEVCVEVFADNFEFFVLGNVQINITASSATPTNDFVVSSNFNDAFFLEPGNSEQCFVITIVDDDVFEREETISIVVTLDTTDLDINIDPPMTTIVILDPEDAEPEFDCSMCGPNSNCVLSANGSAPQCVCRTGYRGDGFTCNNIDECAEGLDRCHANAQCRDTDGGYTCECNRGFRGNGFICHDINECTEVLHLCNFNAECTNTMGGYRCECKPGYSGNGFICKDIDECAQGTDLCHYNAVCVNTDGGYTCECKKGYSGNGFICRDIDECAQGSDLCHDNAVCINLDGGYRCKCNRGYSGNGFICRDIDECATGVHLCADNALCTNTDGGYMCECRPGYSGNGFICRDINECLLGTHNCGANGICTNTIGSFTCSCVEGYRWDGTRCLNINECLEGTDNCDENALCVDTQGSYLCRCGLGFQGDGFTCRRPIPPVQEPPEPEVMCDEVEDDDDTSRSRSTSRSSTGTSRSTTHTTHTTHSTRGTHTTKRTKRSPRSRSSTSGTRSSTGTTTSGTRSSTGTSTSGTSTGGTGTAGTQPAQGACVPRNNQEASRSSGSRSTSGTTKSTSRGTTRGTTGTSTSGTSRGTTRRGTNRGTPRRG